MTVNEGVAYRPARDDGGEVVPEPEAVEVAEEVFAYVQPPGGWCVSNAGFIASDEGVLLIDATATVRRARRLRETVTGLTGRAVTRLVFTHHHGDHTFGAGVFAGARVIAHERCWERMRAEGMLITRLWPATDWGPVGLVQPDQLVGEQCELDVGGLRVEVLHPGVAHSPCDLAVWLPGPRVLFTGDLVFHGGMPVVLAGSVAGSIAALERLRRLRPAVVVPGHGPIGGIEVIDANLAYLRWLQHLAAEALADGASPLDAARAADLGPFAALGERERLVANLHRAIAEASGRPDLDTDIDTVIAEMTAYNGGRVPVCYA